MAIGDQLHQVPVMGRLVEPPEGVTMRQGVTFSGRSRRPGLPDTILVHDNAGPNHPADYLESKRWGVHFIVELDGTVWVGGDPQDELSHGGNWNARSVGLEMRQGFTWNHRHALQIESINTALAGGRMPLYPKAQVASFIAMVRWLWANVPSLVARFPNVAGGKPLHRFVGANHPPGVTAHHHSLAAHADGTIPTAIAFYVIEKGLALDEAMRRAATEASSDGRGPSPIAPADRGPHKPLGPRAAGGGGGGGQSTNRPPATPPKAQEPEPESTTSTGSKAIAVALGTAIGLGVMALIDHALKSRRR